MGRNRKTYDEKFKREVAIEAIREKKTVAEIAAEKGVSPSMVTKWKQELLDGSIGSKAQKEQKRQIDALKKERDEACLELGKTQLMLELLKKKLNSQG